MQIGDVYENYSKELAREANELGLVITQRDDGLYVIEGQPEYSLLPEDEIKHLKRYLSDTDYMVIKCMESAVSMAEVYPEAYQKRIEARVRINELEAL